MIFVMGILIGKRLRDVDALRVTISLNRRDIVGSVEIYVGVVIEEMSVRVVWSQGLRVYLIVCVWMGITWMRS